MLLQTPVNTNLSGLPIELHRASEVSFTKPLQEVAVKKESSTEKRDTDTTVEPPPSLLGE
jgi:hypothetical protein